VCHAQLELAVGVPRPLLRRTIPGQLEADSVGIGEIDRNTHTVVRGSTKRNAGVTKPAHCHREIASAGITNRCVIEAGVVRWRRSSAKTLPRVEAEMVVIVACGKKCRAVAKSSHQVEAQDSTVELQRPIEAAHLQMHVTDSGTGGNLIACFGGR